VDGLPRVRETRGFFLLYFGKSQAQSIPKRVLAPGQAEELRALLMRQLPNRPQLADRYRGKWGVVQHAMQLTKAVGCVWNVLGGTVISTGRSCALRS